MIWDIFIAPFYEFEFLRNALFACMAISLAASPMGIFLLLRRMSLVGDAMSHAVLPGVAIGFYVAGLSLTAMTLGGFIAGLGVALLSGLISRWTPLKEDASFATFYLMSLALGVLLISMRGNQMDLMHILFGSILAVDTDALILICGVSLLAFAGLIFIFRPLVMECFDPDFLRSIGRSGAIWHLIFLALVVLVLVASFQALGTLMSVGLMMLPAAASRFWSRRLVPMMLVSWAIGIISAYIGLVLSFNYDFPSGPSIVLTAGALYCLSMIVGKYSSLLNHWVTRRHYRH